MTRTTDSDNGKRDFSARFLLIIALCLLVAALVIWISVEADKSGLSAICKRINSFGYNYSADEAFIAYSSENVSVSEVLSAEEKELSEIVELSILAGFPADVSTVGEVTVILFKAENTVITLYTLGSEIQLCFLQEESGKISCIKATE